ncbi:MAG: hypothetical protein QXD41_02470 [Nitrososphaeria archaeon]
MVNGAEIMAPTTWKKNTNKIAAIWLLELIAKEKAKEKAQKKHTSGAMIVD